MADGVYMLPFSPPKPRRMYLYVGVCMHLYKPTIWELYTIAYVCVHLCKHQN